ncbi:mitochondrial ribosomal protein [Sporothrix schenckii 1099-18]|uniref:Small ribosomal subunit protein mS29 n=1 Tax=Sporothrix schenckii 1099-18 TaxID=1397361 RepID=A0A0F2M3X9_SPOSC|nr:mitochondrial ribosomal protein [Sporothrix schenckii 1099-18]KJR83784.1 mitochondrial ribosomal protein [Sporothrix schenckii 1099-18]
MGAVVNGSRRLLTRSSTSLALLPARPRSTTVAGLTAAHLSATPTSSYASAFFSTTAVQAKGPVQHIRSGKQVQNVRKKRQVAHSGKPILPGERKAYRKRIVLSNSNALEVHGLEELTAEHLVPSSSSSSSSSESIEEVQNANTGRMLALPDTVVDKLRAIEAFKATQNFHLFRRPSLLLRSEAAALADRLQRDVAGNKQTVRLVIDGERITGKSTLLMQAAAQGFLNGWLVVSIPEAQELTTACTEYAPVPNTSPLQFTQPNYTLRLLQAVLAANGDLLTKYTTSRAYDDLVNPVAAGSTLHDLVSAAKEPDHAWPVFQALWAELCDPSTTTLPRPPVLFTLDGLAHIMRVSDYRAPNFERIHSHDLLLVRAFVDALGGATPFPHGAAILAATTRNNAPLNPTMDLAIRQRLAEQSKADDIPQPEPFFRHYDDRVSAALKTVEALELKGLNRTESRALLEYWAASGVLRERVDEGQVAQAMILSGNGVVGEMERAYLLSLRV